MHQNSSDGLGESWARLYCVLMTLVLNVLNWLAEEHVFKFLLFLHTEIMRAADSVQNGWSPSDL